jgi:hypothetical protein
MRRSALHIIIPPPAISAVATGGAYAALRSVRARERREEWQSRQPKSAVAATHTTPHQTIDAPAITSIMA